LKTSRRCSGRRRNSSTETFYVITVGNIPETFYPEIAENEAQWEEWKKILAIDTLPKDLFFRQLANARRPYRIS